MKDIAQTRNYCAFLRGVNVKGTAMKMADAVSVFEKAGLKNVKSVLASGNILFYSEKPASELKKLIEKELSEAFSYEAFVFIRSGCEVNTIVENAPFAYEEGFHQYVFVAEPGMEHVLLEEFRKCVPAEGERAEISGNTFYWTVSKGNTLDSRFGKILGRRSLKSAFTSRNINTFEKIIRQFNIQQK